MYKYVIGAKVHCELFVTIQLLVQGKDDYQTEADRSAQRCIVASLAAQYPKVNIIGEEDGPDEVRHFTDPSVGKYLIYC